MRGNKALKADSFHGVWRTNPGTASISMMHGDLKAVKGAGEDSASEEEELRPRLTRF
jgi:hypothetical protein